MKTYEELLSDIEDDIELMGASHIVYSMEENNVITDYDYLPSDSCNISTTLKDLQENIRRQMLYTKATSHLTEADKNTPKLAVIFPGIGYTADKPLLYYASRLAKKHGYQIHTVSYSNLPGNIKGDSIKMKQAFELAFAQTEQALDTIDWFSYGSILFISKSIGTAISSAYAAKHHLKVRNILFTPLEDTFSFPLQGSIAFHGTAVHGLRPPPFRLWPSKKKSLCFSPDTPIIPWRLVIYRQIFPLSKLQWNRLNISSYEQGTVKKE